jgi:hypothetical protein
MTEAMDYGTGKQMTTIGHSEIEISKLWLTWQPKIFWKHQKWRWHPWYNRNIFSVLY